MPAFLFLTIHYPRVTSHYPLYSNTFSFSLTFAVRTSSAM
jgi:hypothetical protein